MLLFLPQRHVHRESGFSINELQQMGLYTNVYSNWNRTPIHTAGMQPTTKEYNGREQDRVWRGEVQITNSR